VTSEWRDKKDMHALRELKESPNNGVEASGKSAVNRAGQHSAVNY